MNFKQELSRLFSLVYLYFTRLLLVAFTLYIYVHELYGPSISFRMLWFIPQIGWKVCVHYHIIYSA